MKKTTFKQLIHYCYHYRYTFILALCCSLIQVFFTLLTPIYIGQAIDQMIGVNQVNFPLLYEKIFYILACVLLTALMNWLVMRLSYHMTYSITQDLRHQLFKQYSYLPLSYLDQHAHGDLYNRMIQDIDLIGDGLLQGFTHLFSGIATIIGTIGFMLSINMMIASIVIILTPLSLVVAGFITRRTYKYFQEQLSLRGDMSAYIDEMIDKQKVIQAFHYEQENQQQFDDINQKVHKSGIRSQFYGALVNPSTRVVNSIVYASVCLFGSFYVLSNALSIGALSSFLAYANQYTKPFNELSNVFSELQTALASAQRVFTVFDLPIEKDCSPIPLNNIKGHIQIKDITFSYQKDQPLIEHLSLDVQPGQMIAIVGHTGCGKTTLINLLMRFYDIQKGSITIDDIPIQNMPKSQLRSLFGMVLQDTWLFKGTIKENIAYGCQASDEDIILAAKHAHAHKFIMQLKDGYNTVIEEDGHNLSLGQRQLLCIARIMLLKPPMLILDEATSSIDTRTEKQIQDAFDTMMQGHTTFIVAHRLSTIKKADQIIVMDHGHIIEQGTHQQLLNQQGHYAKLYYSQFEKRG